MKMTSIMIAATIMCVAAFAADVQFLWPEGKMPHPQDNQIAAALADTREPGFKPDLHRKPYIEWVASPKDDVKTDAWLIIISGGGYGSCCDGPAFRPLVEKLISNGVTCVNLMYRTPRPKDLPIYQSAWEDGQRAVRLVRKEATRRGFKPQKIGVCIYEADRGCGQSDPPEAEGINQAV